MGRLSMQAISTANSRDPDARSLLEQARLARGPDLTGHHQPDAAASSHFWLIGAGLLAKLPPKPKRSRAEAAAAELITRTSRQARDGFLDLHVEMLYRTLTKDYGSFVRVEELAFDAAAVPGLVPTRAQVALESGLPQKDKEGLEIDQGIFLSRV